MRRAAVDTRVAVCGGFVGRTTADHTGIRLETHDGFQFTPTYGPDKAPTHWNPANWGGRTPRGEVHAAIDHIFTAYAVERFYCDPRDWRTEVDDWALAYGSEHVSEWNVGGGTTRISVVHAMLERFVTDLTEGTLTHDGCPITAVHVGNARKLAKAGERYVLGKPTEEQKIDMAMASALAHEAACDARASGWQPAAHRKRMIVRR